MNPAYKLKFMAEIQAEISIMENIFALLAVPV
jgi:hypothetical protein